MFVVVVGCWSAEPTIDGALTPAQWAGLQKELAPPQVPDPCAGLDARSCEPLAELGQLLFLDPGLSVGSNPVSCSSCHDPGSNGWFIDPRPPHDVSTTSSGSTTQRNAPTLLNVALKAQLAPADDVDHDMHEVFTWVGGGSAPCLGSGVMPARHPADVVAIAACGKSMDSSMTVFASRIQTEPDEVMAYTAAFSVSPSAQAPMTVFANATLALDAYMRRLVAIDSPFDHYIAGDDSAINESAKRGFGVFVGRGTCITCHSGPLFTDFQFHNTSIPGTDAGRATVTNHVADTGKMLTPSLRNVAMTGPYMHDGSFATLADVIEFYRKGGADHGYVGVRDPLIQPLDLTDQDAQDLEAFLETLTGSPVDTGLPKLSPPAICPTGLASCNGMCFDLSSNSANCGSCDHGCETAETCSAGVCTCSPGTLPCNGTCTDVMTDPTNCGACGMSCQTGSACVMGTCAP